LSIRYFELNLFGGDWVRNTLKICAGYIIGVIIAIFAMSLWRNQEVDWQLMISLIIGGLLGILIISGIRMYMRTTKDKINEE